MSNTATLSVISKSIALMEHTMKLTSNRKRYPIKYVMLVQRIQNKAMDIYEGLMQANRLNVVTQKIERLRKQDEVIMYCDELSCYIELSMNMSLIGSDSAAHWQKLVSDVLYMTMAWRKKDQSR